MTHRNAPLTPHGRQRLIDRVEAGRPLAHVAAEAGSISQACLSKWVRRYRTDGPEGLTDRSSAPTRRPTRLPIEVITQIDQWRRDHK